MLFRWFVGIDPDEVVWNHAVFSKNQERLLHEEVAEVFFHRVLKRRKPYLSDEHFTVDGTLIEAWASHKTSARETEANRHPGTGGKRIFMGRSAVTKRTNRLPIQMLDYKKSKGREDKLPGHARMENRHGLLGDTTVTLAHGTAERDAALLIASQISGVKQGDTGWGQEL